MGPRRVSIKTKLAAALAVPLVALSVVAGLEVMRSLDAAAKVRRQTDLATASIGPSGVINALQHERNYSALWLLGAEVFVDLPVDSLAEARAATDAARSAFALEVADKGDEVARIYSPALAELDRLHGLRDSVDAYTGPRSTTQFNQVAEDSFLGYSELVTALADRNSELVTEVEDHELRRGVQLIDMSSREIDHIAKFVRLGLLGAVTGDRRLADPAEIGQAWIAITAALNNHYSILDFARGPYEAAGDELEVESAATGVIEMGPRIIETGTVDIQEMLTGISLEDDESYYGFLTDVSEILQARADHLNDVAAARSRWYIAAAALVVAAAVVAILAVSRSIVGPLKDLTRQSIAMAERHLPERGPHGAGGAGGRRRPGAGPPAGDRHVAGRGRRRGRDAEHGAERGSGPRRRPGHAAAQRGRRLRQPRPPQPEPDRPPARLHHRAGAQRDPHHRRWRTCSSSTTTPPACGATPSRCSCWRGQRAPASGAVPSTSPTWCGPRSARSKTSAG